MTSTQIHIIEGQYVDPRAGNDKFYRAFAIDSRWFTQYGPNGTLAKVTAPKDLGSTEAALTAAQKKMAGQFKKGYQPHRSGALTVDAGIDITDASAMDALARMLPAGSVDAVITEPVAPVDLAMTVRDDLVDHILNCWMPNVGLDKPATSTDTAPLLPVRPMLASVQSAEVVEAAMLSDDWAAQFKYDGDRVVIEVQDGIITVLNRQGQAKARNIGSEHLEVFTALHRGRWVFDGEVVGRTLVLFDLAQATVDGRTWVNEASTFWHRFWILDQVRKGLDIPLVDDASENASVVLAPSAWDESTKAQFLADAIAQQREGIILRHRDGLYEHGRRSTTLVKHKLIKQADVVVMARHSTKESVSLGVHDAAGNLIEIGAASTIGKGRVDVDDVWLVTFLYVTDPRFPRLYQPRLVSLRHDKAASECSLEQFADAGTTKAV